MVLDGSCSLIRVSVSTSWSFWGNVMHRQGHRSTMPACGMQGYIECLVAGWRGRGGPCEEKQSVLGGY